jgi:hypothetical protein
VEHSRPRALGGTDHANNLYAACIPCNRENSHLWSTRTVRARNGQQGAPLSRTKRAEAKRQQALTGAVLCRFAGSVFGPFGAIVGAAIGDEQNPDQNR